LKKRRFRIGFANLGEAMPFARIVRQGLEAAQENIELFIRDHHLDSQTAFENAEWFVASHVFRI
jgi:hypothetical protein